MKWRQLGNVVILVLIANASAAAAQLLPSQAKGAARAQIVMLSVDNGCAAGIIVGFDEKEVYIATAAHVAALSTDHLPPAIVSFEGVAQPRQGKFWPQFQKRDAGDLAVVMVNRDASIDKFIDELDFSLLSPVELGSAHAPVTSIGCFGGAVWSSGTNETLLTVKPVRGYLQFESDVAEGQSGGGLYNEAWELIGMPLDMGPNGVLARPINTIIDDLHRWHIPIRLAARGIKNRARGADEIARENAAVAKSRALAARAQIELRNDLQRGVLLALRAVHDSVTNEALVELGRIWDHPLERTLYGEAKLRAVAFSPNGELLATGGLDGKLILWDAKTGKRRTTFDSGGSFVSSVAFSRDGKLIADGSDSSVVVWDAANGARLRTLQNHSDAVYSVVFSPNGKEMASASADHRIILWNVNDWTPKRTLEGHSSDVYTLAFSPDGKMLASGGEDKDIILWDVASGTRIRTLKGSTDAVFCVAFSLNGERLASGYGARDRGGLKVTLAKTDKDVILWDVRSGKRLFTLTGHTNGVSSVAFSPDGKILVSGSGDRTIIMWDVDDGSRLQTLEAHTASVNGLSFSPDGAVIASVGEDGKVIIWDGPQGIPHEMLSGDKGRVTSVAFRPGGRILASGGEAHEVVLWDIANGTHRLMLDGHTKAVNSVTFSPDGRILASGGADHRIILWDVQTGGRSKIIDAPSSVFSIAFSPDGRELASGGFDNNITLWDVVGGTHLRTLLGEDDDIVSIAFSPDGKLLASNSRFGKLIVWDSQTGNRLRILGEHGYGLTFSADGKQLASSAPRSADVLRWETRSFTPLLTLQSSTRLQNGRPGLVYSLAFSADGKYITSGYDLWDATDATRLATLENDRFVHAVAFSPDGTSLAVTDDYNHIILWDLDLSSWKARACRMAGRNLTQSEWDEFVSDGPYARTCVEFPSLQESVLR